MDEKKERKVRRALAGGYYQIVIARSYYTARAPVFPNGPRHFVFFGMERDRIRDTAFLKTQAFVGAQLKYMWRELEPQKNVYDFTAVRRDLDFLTGHRKKLWIQLQDSTFSPDFTGIPPYLLKDPAYNGGSAKQYTISGGDEKHATVQGWVSRRWDKEVQERFVKLLNALGREFDDKIEGINLPETAVDFGESGYLFPSGFTPTVYRDAIIANLAALKRAFPRCVTMQYANFMPGEWLPDNDRGYLKSVFQQAKRLRVGVGGPDLLPYKPGQMKHSYPLIRGLHSSDVATGIAVQEGNYAALNPKTGKPITLPELLQFATEYLQVRYVFWCTEEPYFSRKLVPFLRRSA